MKEFKSIHIDLEKGIYELSGVDISKEPISKFAIWFDNGTWLVSYDIAVTFESEKGKETATKKTDSTPEIKEDPLLEKLKGLQMAWVLRNAERDEDYYKQVYKVIKVLKDDYTTAEIKKILEDIIKILPLITKIEVN